MQLQNYIYAITEINFDPIFFTRDPSVYYKGKKEITKNKTKKLQLFLERKHIFPINVGILASFRLNDSWHFCIDLGVLKACMFAKMYVSVICTYRGYFSSNFDGNFFNGFLRKIPFRKMHSVIM